MARTIRRKKEQWEFEKWNLHDWDYVKGKNGQYFTKIPIKKYTKEYQQAWHNYHGDKKHYGSSVPSWFVNAFCERPLRQRTKNELKKWEKNSEYEVMVPLYIHDAAWKYY